MSSIKRAVVHCSFTMPEQDIGADDIRIWHVRDNGWSDIGYHYVIRRDGRVERGRYEDGDNNLDAGEVGAHAYGFNRDSIGICLVGGMSEHGKEDCNYTRAQYNALSSLLIGLTVRIPGIEILGHRDLPHVVKTCPIFDVREWWDA